MGIYPPKFGRAGFVPGREERSNPERTLTWPEEYVDEQGLVTTDLNVIMDGDHGWEQGQGPFRNDQPKPCLVHVGL